MITTVDGERRYFDRNGLEITEGCEIRFLHGDRSLERVETVYLCEDGQLGTDATNPAWIASGRAAPCEYGIYPLTREDTEGCELAALSRERMDMGEYLRDVDGTMCICHEAVKPGFMRMAVEAWFEADGEIYRKAHMLVPIDMPSEELDDLAAAWLAEQEKELGFQEGESSKESHWSVGYQLNADQAEHEYEYDWLVAEYCGGNVDEMHASKVQEFEALAEKYGFIVKREGNAYSLCAKDTDNEWTSWIKYYPSEDTVSYLGHTDYLNIWLYETRKDFTPEVCLRFVDDLNALFELEGDDKFSVRELIDPEDWQEIAGVRDAFEDSRYTSSRTKNEVGSLDGVISTAAAAAKEVNHRKETVDQDFVKE